MKPILILLTLLVVECGASPAADEYGCEGDCGTMDGDAGVYNMGILKAEHPTNIPCVQCKCIQLCGSELGKMEPIDPRLYDCTEHDKKC